MRYFKIVLILILAATLTACTSTEIQTEYVIVTATPEATRPPTNTPVPTHTASPIPITQVVIAVQEIPAGIQIKEHMVVAVEFPAEYMPMGAYSNVEDIIGAYVGNSIVREEIVLDRKLMSDPDGNLVREAMRTVFASQDIGEGEPFERGMYYFAYISPETLELFNINFDDVFDSRGGISTKGWVANMDIQAFTPILKSMVSQ